MDTRFHCVYLLTSLDPRCEGDYYIGYTVNPLRRLRQHNGELVNGARRTSRRGRPWTIVCCVSGFTEDRAALKFEWCWQNPTVSARLKHTVGILKGLRRLPYAVGTLHLLIRAPLFAQLDLTLHIFEPQLLKEAKHQAEAFLSVRRGPGSPLPASSPAPISPATSAMECSSYHHPSSLMRTQAPHTAPPHESTPLPTPLATALPPLDSTALFHVEVTTRRAFEEAYLSHDRCLLLHPLTGGAAGAGSLLGSGVPSAYDNDGFSMSGSCPYDVSLLSQAARAEWSHASFDLEYHHRSPGGTNEDTIWLVPNDVRTPSLSPHADRVPSQSSVLQERVLGYRSEERADARRPGVRRRNCAAPRSIDPVTRPSQPPSPGDSIAPSPVSSSPSSSSPLPTSASREDATVSVPVVAPADPPPPLRIPLRFAHYRDVDFTDAHAAEQHRLYHGLLPCSLCALPLRPPHVAHCSRAPFCELRCHLSCLALWMLYAEEEITSRDATTAACADAACAPAELPPCASFRRLIPSRPCPCPLCGVQLQWGTLIKDLKKRVVVEGRLQAARRRCRMEQQWRMRLAHINGSRLAEKGRRGRQQKRPRGEADQQENPAAVRSPAFANPAPANARDAAASLVSAVHGSSFQASEAPLPFSDTTDLSAKGGKAKAAPVSAAASPARAAPLLTWTDICEDDWLV